MSSSPLVGTYKRYKAGTQKLLKWLCESQPPSASSITSSPRKKSAKRSINTPKKIAVDALVGLAERIIAADPRIDIPLDILDATNDCIEGRRECADWYAAFSNSHSVSKEMLESNAKHQYFLQALQQVFETLRREIKSRRPKRKKKIELIESSDLSKLYHCLELEEITEVEDGPRQHKKQDTSASTARRTIEQEYEVADSEKEEAAFEVYCLFHDLHELRCQNLSTWQAYQQGRISFVSACHMSDSVIQLMFRISDQFHADHIGLETFSEIVDLLGRDAYTTTARNTSYTEFREQQGDGTADMSLVGHPEFLLMPAWSVIQDVMYLAAHLGYECNPESVPVSIFPGQSFAKSLLDIVGDLLDMTRNEETGEIDPATHRNSAFSLLVFGDHFTTALILFVCRKAPFSVGLTAATAVYMDIACCLRGDLARGVRECGPLIDHISNRANDFTSWHGSLPSHVKAQVPCAPNGILWTAIDISTHQKHGEGDGWTFYTPDPDTDLSIQGQKRTPRLVPMSVLSTLPVLVGQATWRSLYKLQALGMIHCRSSQTLLVTAHLHNAARIQSTTHQTWPDMEFAIARETTQQLLRQGDGSLRSAAKQLCYALGMSVNQVASVSRPRYPGRSKCDRDAIHCILGSYLQADRESEPKTHGRDYAKVVFNHSALDMRKLYESIKLFVSSGPGIQDEKIAKQWAVTKRLTPRQVVQVLQEITTEDQQALHFDYLGLFMRCTDLLASVTDAYWDHHDLKPTTYRGNHTKHMSETMYDILWEAAGIETRELDPSNSVLFKAGDVIDRMLKSKGDLAILHVQESMISQQLYSQKPAVLYGPQAIMLPIKPFPSVAPVIHANAFGSYISMRTATMFKADNEESVLAKASSIYNEWKANGMSESEAFKAMLDSVDTALAQLGIRKHVHSVHFGADGKPEIELIADKAQIIEDARELLKSTRQLPPPSMDGIGETSKQPPVHEFMEEGIWLLPPDMAELVKKGGLKALREFEDQGGKFEYHAVTLDGLWRDR